MPPDRNCLTSNNFSTHSENNCRKHLYVDHRLNLDWQLAHEYYFDNHNDYTLTITMTILWRSVQPSLLTSSCLATNWLAAERHDSQYVSTTDRSEVSGTIIRPCTANRSQ